MAIIKKFLTKNRTYTNPTMISPKWIVVHSVGTAALPTKDKLWDSWNSSAFTKSCHGMVDAEGGWVTLPLNYKGWHVGKSGNNTSIGFEVCEPAMIAYEPGSFNSRIDKKRYSMDTPGAMEDFCRRYNNAVEMAAYMCRETGLGADNVVCHQEAARKGMATNHADVQHWFPVFGKSMDDFRADVAKALAGQPIRTEPAKPSVSEPIENEKTTGLPYIARVTASLLNVRSGPGVQYAVAAKVRKGEAYTIVEERNGFGRLKSGAGWVSLNYMEKV